MSVGSGIGVGICFRKRIRKGNNYSVKKRGWLSLCNSNLRDGNKCVPRAGRSTFISQYGAINVFALVGTSLLDARTLLDPNKSEWLSEVGNDR